MPNYAKNSSIKEGTLEKRKEAYAKKYAEYDLLSLEDLEKLFKQGKGKTRIGGIYKRAMIDVVSKKLQEKSLAESTIVTELPQTNNEVNDISRAEQPDNSVQQEQTT